MNYKSLSVSLLESLCSPIGIKASKSAEGNYHAVFTRDAVMAGLAGLLIGNTVVKRGLVLTLETLKRTQKKQGQIASNVQLLEDGSEKISYGTLSYKTDSLGFYLIGVGMAIKHALIVADDWKESIYKTLEQLEALEYNGRNLIYVPQGGNWADEYPYHGYVLFDQSLRMWGTKLMADIYCDEKLKQKASSIEIALSENYFLKADSTNPYHKMAHLRAIPTFSNYYLTAFTPSGYRMEFDLAANVITSLLIQNDDSQKALNWISEQQTPISAFWPIIQPEHKDWAAISDFFLYEFKNKPGHYHNGGIWWIWLGWLRQSYLKNGFIAEAEKLRSWAIDFLENHQNFEFDEYLSFPELEPCGTKWLGYTATGIILLTIEKTFDPLI